MSTVMYCFKSKDQATFDQQVEVMRQYYSNFGYFSETIDIQVFHTSVGILFRVLEAGYGLRNFLWKDSEQFPTCNYDDRTDITEEEEGNEAIADEIDNLIADHRYEVITFGDKPQP
jgi:hypothetical protein